MTNLVRSFSICKACKRSELTIDRVVYNDYVTGSAFELKICKSCNAAFTHPVPADIDYYYPENYRRYGKLVILGLELVFIFLQNSLSRRFKVGRQSSLLEIGCGPGLLLRFFRDRGWKTVGIERNERVANLARLEKGLEIYACDIADLPTDQSFDLVLMFNVLEHLDDPITVLRECRNRLSVGGRIVVTVPNFNCWQRRIFKDYWLHLDVPRHLSHFTSASLEALASHSDLVVESSRNTAFIHDLYGWVDSFLSRIVCRQNILTSWLMGLRGFSSKVLIALLLAPAAILAFGPITLISWIFRKSSLTEFVIARDDGTG
ncbi:class I SAM-dependent methyltransferase [Litoricolaceae bacterium]|nr:class I SAM-dependent methyltransferase [Litorivicinaceae bacterium]